VHSSEADPSPAGEPAGQQRADPRADRAHAELGHPEDPQPASGQPGYGQPHYQQPEYPQPEYPQPEYRQPDYGQPDYRQPGRERPRTRRPVLHRRHTRNQRTGRRRSTTSTPRNCLGDRTPAGFPTRLHELQPRAPLRRSTPRQQRPPARAGRPTSLIRIPGTPSQPAPKRLIGMLPTNRRPRTRPTPALTRAKPSTPSPMSICLGSP